MSTRETMTGPERIDLLLHQAEQFRSLDLRTEAISRARHALAQCDKELARASDPREAREILTRRTLALDLLRRMGGPPLPSTEEHGTI